MRRLVLVALLIVLSGPAEARTFKGDGPRTLAVGYGAVWIGHGDGTVTRVDAETMRARSTLLGSGMGGYSITSLATGFGSVWAAPNSTPLHRLDPRTARVMSRIWRLRGGWTPTVTAVGRGSVWSLDFRDDAIFRVDPRTNRISGRKFVPNRLRGIAVGSAGAWIVTIPGRGPVTGPEGPRIVSRLEPRTLRLHRAFRLHCDVTLQPLGRSLWVLDNCDGRLRRFDTRTGTFDSSIETVPGAWGLAAGFGSLWVSDGSTVRRIDPARPAVVARIEATGGGLAAGAGSVWVLDYGDGTKGWLRRIDPRTNRLTGPALKIESR